MLRRLCIVLGLLLALPVLGAQDLKLQVLSTTDMHGHVMPEDTFSLQARNQGWARLAPLIQARRAQNPNTLLIDSGDTLQGEPINYVRHTLRRDLPDPSAAVMNYLGYQAMAVGNHEYNFGLPILREVEAQCRFPWLSANTVSTKDGQPAFKPYTVITVAGVKVGVLGFTTPGVPKWEEPANYAGLRFEDIVASARTWVPLLRNREKVDVVLVAMHSGLGSATGASGDENAALRLAEQVPGIDALLTGHTHRPIQTTHKGIPIVQAECYGRSLAVVELGLTKREGRWTVVSREASLLKPAEDGPLDPEVLALTADLRKETNAYLDTPTANLAVDLDCRFARMEDTAVMQLILEGMRKASGAQLAAAACFDTKVFIPKGPTSVRQWYALLPYENRIARIRLSGAQLKAYLEHAASYYNNPALPELYSGRIWGYDFDMVLGVSYALDLMKPFGSRVTDLRFEGQPVKADQSFTMAITTYRLRGGGGYLEAIGWKGEPEVITPQLHRNLLLEQVLKEGTVTATPRQHWRTIPYLDRERVLGAK
jgi:2',3'-cyclic-nucleotide 2'-phosphodiesterase/3'-nucleotidase